MTPRSFKKPTANLLPLEYRQYRHLFTGPLYISLRARNVGYRLATGLIFGGGCGAKHGLQAETNSFARTHRGSKNERDTFDPQIRNFFNRKKSSNRRMREGKFYFAKSATCSWVYSALRERWAVKRVPPR